MDKDKTAAIRQHFLAGLRGVLPALALLYFLFCHGMTLQYGRADNGDFERSIRTFIEKPYGFSSFAPPDGSAEGKDRYFSFYIPLWEISQNPAFPVYRHSVHLLWLPGWLLNQGCFSRDLVDLKYVGLFPRLILFLVLLYLARFVCIDRRGSPLVLLLGLTLIFSDLHYTTFFNSFYQETGGFIYGTLFLFLLACLAWRRGTVYSYLALICLALFACAKVQYCVTALFGAGVWAVWMIVFPAGTEARRGYRRIIPAAALAGLALVVFADGRSIGARSGEMRKVNAYHRLFKGLLMVSRNPEAHLARLGFPPDAQKYLGTEAFDAPVQDFYQSHEFTLAQALKVIGQEPATLARLAGRAAERMNRIEIPECGIYQKGTFMGDRYLRAYRPWSIVKKHLFPTGLGLWILYFTIFAVAVGGMLTRWAAPVRILCLVALVSLTSCLIEMFTAALGDGLAGLDKHLFMANVFQDLAIVFILCAVAEYFESRRSAVAAD